MRPLALSEARPCYGDITAVMTDAFQGLRPQGEV